MRPEVLGQHICGTVLGIVFGVVSVGSQTILSLGFLEDTFGLLSVELRNQVVTGLGHLRV